MARKRTGAEPATNAHELAAATLAAAMPGDRGGLLDVAAEAVKMYTALLVV